MRARLKKGTQMNFKIACRLSLLLTLASCTSQKLKEQPVEVNPIASATKTEPAKIYTCNTGIAFCKANGTDCGIKIDLSQMTAAYNSKEAHSVLTLSEETPEYFKFYPSFKSEEDCKKQKNPSPFYEIYFYKKSHNATAVEIVNQNTLCKIQNTQANKIQPKPKILNVKCEQN